MQLKTASAHFEEFLQTYSDQRLKTTLLKPVEYILSLGGKRIRPAIVVWVNQLYGGDLKEALTAALAIEMFHNFSLVHDDIMDEAPLRRGKMSVHTKWDNNTAILSGDAMLVLVYEILSDIQESHLKSSLKLFNSSALNVCEGQQLDMDFEKREQIELDEYISMIGMKTGDLLGASFALGALLANAPKKDIENLYSFGKKTGIAFQLQDDILDLYGNQEKVGKQVGGDIIANKKTCLWIRAFEKANQEELHKLKEMMHEKDASNKVKLAQGLFEQLDVKKDAEEYKTRYQKEAFEHLGSTTLNTDQKEEVKAFAMSLLSRES